MCGLSCLSSPSQAEALQLLGLLWSHMDGDARKGNSIIIHSCDTELSIYYMEYTVVNEKVSFYIVIVRILVFNP